MKIGVLFLSMFLFSIPALCLAQDTGNLQDDRGFIHPIGRSLSLVVTVDGGWFIQYYPETGPRPENTRSADVLKAGESHGLSGGEHDPDGSTGLRITDHGCSLIWNASPPVAGYSTAAREPEYLIMHR
jgi:hypothetical protein